MSEYIRGSEWRRWDLHIHTPGTIKNDQFEGSTLEERWDNYYKSISEYIRDDSDKTKSICAIGVTDYLSIDNYKKVVDDKKLPQSIKLILPNVELRMAPMSRQEGINIHFIFDPSIVTQLEDRFFSRLSFSHGNREYSATRAQLISLGKAIDGSLNDDTAYKKGIGQFIPSVDSLIRLFANDKELRNKTIIIVSNGSNDGVSGVANMFSHMEAATSDFDATRQSIYQFVDAIFSSNPNDVEYFLGEKSDSPDEVIRKCGSLKPCFHGSDAHTNTKVFEPDEQRYCWIKADPSFNGLKQVLYEPKDRVRISSLVPEEKSEYHVIDRMEIDDSDFSHEPILFNDKLTCIIGGKSTGKSILLHNLALTIDKKQVSEKTEKSKAKTRILQKVKVIWKDGTECSTDAQNDTHKIIYIPQTYLNRLSDENEEKTEIDTIIEDIVLQNENAKKAYVLMQNQLQEYKPILDKRIYDTVRISKELNELNEQSSEIGSKTGIEKQLASLKSQKDAKSRELSLSEEDVAKYDHANSQINQLRAYLSAVCKEISTIQSIESVVYPAEIDASFCEETRIEMKKAVEDIVRLSKERWNEVRAEIIDNLNHKKESIESKIVDSERVIDQLKGKIESNEAIIELTKRIQEEEQRLIRIKEYETKIAEKISNLNDSLIAISESNNNFYSIQKQYANVVNDEGSSINQGSDLTFSVAIPFRSEAFCKSIKQLFDNRTLKSKKDIIDVDNYVYNDFGTEGLIRLIRACIDSSIPFSKGYSLESSLRMILDNWYNVTYNVKMGDDLIDEMSPGKKALVLLKLLVSMAESKSPILIDQPEDDLDNKSISEDLISFIKRKKIERQIIVVTHNANVVVGGDAEQVIVANQRGNTTPNHQFRFEYRTGSIEDNMPVTDANNNVLSGILNVQGIQQHICDILEGGEKAFEKRRNKYNIKR